MDYLKPPTDNLYKFLAVSGVLAVAACLYGAHISRENLDKAADKFIQSEFGRTGYVPVQQSLLRPLPPFLRPNMTRMAQPPDEPLLSKYRMEWIEYINSEANRLLEGTNFPGLDEMRPYFEQDIVRRHFMEVEGLSDEEYADMVSDMTYGKFLEITKGEREFYAFWYDRINDLMESLSVSWGEIDRYSNVEERYNWWLVVAVCFTAGGFVFWWMLYQRHQDAILAAQVKDATGKEVSNPFKTVSRWLFAIWHRSVGILQRVRRQ